MAKEAAVMLLLMLASEVPRLPANPLECRENEYLDDVARKCIPCKPCGPGMELSQECGFGEGSHARCVPCHPRRFKEGWGPQRCKPCASCALINRLQRSNCTAASDAACAECLPGFYSKTQIGGFRDLECVPCTKQTPPSEPQCRARASGEPVGGHSPPAPDRALLALTGGALAIVLLAILTASILGCRRFWKRQCQRALRRSRSRSLPVPRVTFQASEPSCFCSRNAKPLEGPLEVGPRLPEAGPMFGCRPEAALRWPVTPAPEAPPAGNPFESHRPLLRNPVGLGGPFCAAERQPRWPHVPVECTETDLQGLSIVDEAPSSPPPSCHNPSTESREPAGGDVQNLVTEMRDVAQDLPIIVRR